MLKTTTAFVLCALTAVVFVVLGLWLGYSEGHAEGYQLGIDNHKPMPPATICTLKMPSSKYRQLDCARHAWRKTQ